MRIPLFDALKPREPRSPETFCFSTLVVRSMIAHILFRRDDFEVNGSIGGFVDDLDDIHSRQWFVGG